MKFDKINSKNSIFKITPEIARIHAHVCGDGSSYRTKSKRVPGDLIKHKRMNVEYFKKHLKKYKLKTKHLAILQYHITKRNAKKRELNKMKRDIVLMKYKDPKDPSRFLLKYYY